MSVPPDRFARGGRQGTGNPVFEWKMTELDLTGLVKLVAQTHVLPVVFVPGIMGSNLMDLEQNTVWRLDSGTFSLPWSLISGVGPKGPAGRQRIMHPDRTQVDGRGNVPNVAGGTVFGTKKKDREAVYRNERFWGEIGDSSYHEYLLWLEEHLNGHGASPELWPDFGYTQPMVSAAPAPGQKRQVPKLMPGFEMAVRGFTSRGAEKSGSPLMSDDLIKRAKFRMPVYACGYNWLASNEVGAKRLRDRINAVIAAESKRGKCEQVLLITHSMGGLVARRCAQLAGMEAKIAGVVHGVMPTTGAAVAYRRCKVGMNDEDAGAGFVIGSNGREVTAVFAQAPGALQLLPTAEYPSGWLKIKDEKGKALETQPGSDPYDAIYLRQDRWWGLVRPEWLRPEGGRPITWNQYRDNMLAARDFHNTIKGSFHPKTHVYYGADTNFPSFETVEWSVQTPIGPYGMKPTSQQQPPAAQVAQMGFDEVTDSGWTGYSPSVYEKIPADKRTPYGPQPRHLWTLRCGMQDGGGDGTVPISSGRAPMTLAKNKGHIQYQFRLSGFGHEPSYKNANARLATLFSIQKIAAGAKAAA